MTVETDSLDLVELVMELEDRYGVKISEEDISAWTTMSAAELAERLRRLFEEPDAAELAEHLRRLFEEPGDEEGGSAVREPRRPRPPSPLTDAAVAEPAASEEIDARGGEGGAVAQE